MDARTLSCIRSAIRRLGRTPSFSASSFTTTAPRIEISRVETESDIDGLAGCAGTAGAFVPTPMPIVAVGRGLERRIDTELNPALSPPTRVDCFTGAVGFFGAAGAGFGAGGGGGGGGGGGCLAAACRAAACCCFWEGCCFAAVRLSRALLCT